MKNLSKCHWGAFAIDEIFSGNERGKRLVVPERIEGVTPLITAGEVDNGVSAFIANPEQKEYGDSITLDMFANVFYHPYKFNCDDNITVLSNKECSKYAYLFIVVALRMLRGKYSYAYQVRPNRLSKDKIMLPVGKNNKPDYAFMDQYMRAQERKLLAQYKSRIDNLLKVDILTGGGHKLKDRKWGDFSVTKIFRIESGKRLESNRMKLGRRPFIGAADSRNGVTNFVSNVNESLDKNVLGVNYNGNGMVISFHHPYECIFSDDVKRFHLKDAADDKYVHLFLKEMLLCQKKKFCYGYKFNASRMARQKIMLPVRRDGKPDYEFMRDYMKQCERRRLIAYRDRIEELLSA